MLKVVKLTNMLPPYRIGFYEFMAKNYEFTVLTDQVNLADRHWEDKSSSYEFDFEVLDSTSFSLKRNRPDLGYSSRREFSFSFKTFFKLKRKRPDVVISIEYGFKTLWALAYCKIFRRKIIVWSEGTLHTEGNPNLMRRAIRGFIVPKVDMFFTNGEASTALVNKYKPHPNSKIVEAMTGVRTHWWRQRVEEHLPNRELIRSELKIEGTCILVNGSLTEAKGIPQLLAALEKWKQKKLTLLLIGSGDLEGEILKWAETRPLINIVMPGFIDPEEMPRYMAAADWSVLATLDDNWPLAALEVLVSGLPQLFSKYNGGTVDLCIPGVTGFEFDPLNEDDFLAALDQIDSSALRVTESVIDIMVERYSPEAMGLRARNALDELTEGSKAI